MSNQLFMSIRCPIVKNGAQQCRRLCQPVWGYGWCGRKIEAAEKPEKKLAACKRPARMFIIP
jgi:hypothetical protein